MSLKVPNSNALWGKWQVKWMVSRTEVGQAMLEHFCYFRSQRCGSMDFILALRAQLPSCKCEFKQNWSGAEG